MPHYCRTMFVYTMEEVVGMLRYQIMGLATLEDKKNALTLAEKRRGSTYIYHI